MSEFFFVSQNVIFSFRQVSRFIPRNIYSNMYEYDRLSVLSSEISMTSEDIEYNWSIDLQGVESSTVPSKEKSYDKINVHNSGFTRLSNCKKSFFWK